MQPFALPPAEGPRGGQGLVALCPAGSRTRNASPSRSGCPRPPTGCAQGLPRGAGTAPPWRGAVEEDVGQEKGWAEGRWPTLGPSLQTSPATPEPSCSLSAAPQPAAKLPPAPLPPAPAPGRPPGRGCHRSSFGLAQAPYKPPPRRGLGHRGDTTLGDAKLFWNLFVVLLSDPTVKDAFNQGAAHTEPFPHFPRSEGQRFPCSLSQIQRSHLGPGPRSICQKLQDASAENRLLRSNTLSSETSPKTAVADFWAMARFLSEGSCPPLRTRTDKHNRTPSWDKTAEPCVAGDFSG